MVEHLEPGRARDEVDPVAADVGVRPPIAVVQQERATAPMRWPPPRCGAGTGRAPPSHPWQPVIEQAAAHLLAADLHPDLGQDAHRLVHDPPDELVVEDVERWPHAGSSGQGRDSPSAYPSRWRGEGLEEAGGHAGWSEAESRPACAPSGFIRRASAGTSYKRRATSRSRSGRSRIRGRCPPSGCQPHIRAADPARTSRTAASGASVRRAVRCRRWVRSSIWVRVRRRRDSAVPGLASARSTLAPSAAPPDAIGSPSRPGPKMASAGSNDRIADPHPDEDREAMSGRCGAARSARHPWNGRDVPPRRPAVGRPHGGPRTSASEDVTIQLTYTACRAVRTARRTPGRPATLPACTRNGMAGHAEID